MFFATHHICAELEGREKEGEDKWLQVYNLLLAAAKRTLINLVTEWEKEDEKY